MNRVKRPTGLVFFKWVFGLYSIRYLLVQDCGPAAFSYWLYEQVFFFDTLNHLQWEHP